jgi:hypothetical protein
MDLRAQMLILFLRAWLSEHQVMLAKVAAQSADFALMLVDLLSPLAPKLLLDMKGP